ncbi:hypothetical protein niasHT_012930 [Heterodera trifolii]|uniref:Uncharacterized protein n=1 Tax=Heterodera trifolii TaxID=157864 RepID=A0ABD2LKG6_9BILA
MLNEMADLKAIINRLSAIEKLISTNNNNTLATEMTTQFSAIAERLTKESVRVMVVLPNETLGGLPTYKVSFGSSTITRTLSFVSEIVRKINNNNNGIGSAEDKERKRSIVLIGLPESEEEVPSLRAKDVAKTVEEVLDRLDVEVCPQMVYRMGRRIDEKRKGPRLVKVVLPASTFQRYALMQWGRRRTELKKNAGWERLLVRPSLMKEELEIEREQRQRKWTEFGQKKAEENITTRRGGNEKNF